MTRVALLTSVSEKIAEMAALTIPNKAEYCLRHGYTLVARNLPYDAAVRDFGFIKLLLNEFQIVWSLDCDAVVTNMTEKIEDVPGLHDGMNVCLENIHPAVTINCGSVAWKSSDDAEPAQVVLDTLASAEPEWKCRQWIWQQWVEEQLVAVPARKFPDYVHVHRPRAFNSCCHGTRRNWGPGDLVFHPCGEEMGRRIGLIREALPQVVR